MTQKRTGGHYDEITKIQRLRSNQLYEIREKLNQRQGDQKAVREQSYPNTMQTLRKTTVRKSPAGHH